MDLSTHLTLAAKLLDSCGCSRRATIFALLPEIDITPAHYHRMFGNILMYQTVLLDTAIEVFKHPEVAKRDFSTLREDLAPVIRELKDQLEALENDPATDRFEMRDAFNRHYCYSQLLAELPTFCDELDKVHSLLGDEILNPSTDRDEGAVALLSHTYFVTYTYPPMPFIPFSPMSSQRIAFADRIDYFDFKGLFLDGNVREKLARELVEHPTMWSRSLDLSSVSDPTILERLKSEDGHRYRPSAMVKAMIERLGELAPGIEYDAIQKGIRWYLGYLGCVRVVHSDRERLFLEHADQHLEETMVKVMDEMD